MINKDLFFKRAHEGKEPSLRPIASNEVVIEFEGSRKENEEWLHETENLLFNHSFEVYDHNGKSSHLHLRIEGLEKLDPKERQKYKKEFIKKYTPEGSIPDFSLCNNRHLVASEGFLHFKRSRLGEEKAKHYTVKKLLRTWNEGIKIRNPLEKDLLEDKKTLKKYEFEDCNADILRVASFYGLEPIEQNQICLLHADKNPSFKLYPETNSFYCFGCGASGNALKLIRLFENCSYKTALRIANYLTRGERN